MSAVLLALMIGPTAPWDPREMAPEYLALWRRWTRGEGSTPSHVLPDRARNLPVGFYVVPGFRARANTAQAHGSARVWGLINTPLFTAESQIELFGGPRTQSLPFWNPLYDPDYQIYTWDPQPIVGWGSAPE